MSRVKEDLFAGSKTEEEIAPQMNEEDFLRIFGQKEEQESEIDYGQWSEK